MNVLFTGSRDANAAMLRVVDDTLYLMRHDLDTVIVGDAGGIDKKVMECCDQYCITYEIHGAYGKMRNTGVYGKRVVHSCGYLERDRIMARLCGEGICYAVWNGKWNQGIVGRSGTVATARYAEQYGAEVIWLYRKP